MNSVVDDLEQKLNTFEQKFYLLIEQYNKQYPLYKNSDNKEYKTIFLNTKSNITKVQQDLFLLENKIHTEINKLHDIFDTLNTKIEKDKKYLKKIKKLNDKLKNISTASFPFRKQMKLNKTENKVYLLYHSIGILGLAFLIILSYRS
tara:strand:- start:52 stop:492 length:441 start_codon:yes stop_codon:yes gene_type:complete